MHNSKSGDGGMYRGLSGFSYRNRAVERNAGEDRSESESEKLRSTWQEGSLKPTWAEKEST